MHAPVAAAELEPRGSARAFALIGGSLAVVLVAALVVTLTPQQTATTASMSATTVPAPSRFSDAATSAVEAAKSIRASTLAAATAIPNAIADVPEAAIRRLTADDVAPTRAVLPDLDDHVTVLTEHFAYSVTWREVGRLLADDAIVVDNDGVIVGRIDDGRLIVSHDMVVGAWVSVD